MLRFDYILDLFHIYMLLKTKQHKRGAGEKEKGEYRVMFLAKRKGVGVLRVTLSLNAIYFSETNLHVEKILWKKVIFTASL